MVSIVPSMFAGLRIEDDEDEISRPKNRNKNKNKIEVPQKKPNKPKKVKKPTKPNPEQWARWQAKDSEIVDNDFEKNLEEALLMSKLDFEENKDKYIPVEPELKALKSKKSKPLTLQEFQTKLQKEYADAKIIANRALNAVEVPTNENLFFEQINYETREIIRKEKFKALAQMQENSSYPSDSEVQKLEKEMLEDEKEEKECSEMGLLREENASLRNEVITLKSKYKKICSVLKYGEMKDKTELLVEIEKLKKVQADMTAEMTSLYAQLEQEKSKTHIVNYDNKYKEKNLIKKSVRFDASSEVTSENKF